MKKTRIALSFCSVFLLFACTTDEGSHDKNQTTIENKKQTNTTKYINLEELQKDNYSYLKFQQMEADLNILRNSKMIDNNQFVFLIDTEKILFIENAQSKTFTFPIYRSAKSQLLENLVLKIDNKGISESYIVKYNLTDSDKAKIKNREILNLENKTEIFPLTSLVKTINSKTANNGTNKGILLYWQTCWELVPVKIIDIDSYEYVQYQYLPVTCVENIPTPSGTLIDPTTVPQINTNVNYSPVYQPPYNYDDLPYTLGNDFSSYPVLDDINEANNVSARYFFDSLTYPERKWALYNASLYTTMLQKLTEKNWGYSYENFARNVIWQMTQYHICHATITTDEIESELFNFVMAGGTIMTVAETCLPKHN
ncbi:hypothetical protein [Flavobacterium hungaricum]|uniref:Lipoprotein n=1 Tax=Flavobacterium hungaricum TaxID=2082725 RepID=A0ABR9TF12_9FLAO|nr:hypothetical protein [Flavobacterium hungaricum]MBE8723920.1 hypothetical protein [Flavobacterium hungaricum]